MFAAADFRAVGVRHDDGTPVLEGLTVEVPPGEELVDRRDTRARDPITLCRRIGDVLQDAGLFPHTSAADDVAVVPRLEDWPAADVARAFLAGAIEAP